MTERPKIEYKMFCVYAQESLDKMKGLRGKLSSMSGHAYLHAWWDAIPGSHIVHLDVVERRKWVQAISYKNSGLAAKITLVVDTVEQLKALQESYKDICGTSLVTDAGRTVFGEPTTVCLGIGPIHIGNVKEDVSTLKALT